MGQYRFIDNNLNLKEDKKIEIENERIVHQLSKVLRVKEGQNIELCDGNLNEAEAEIAGIDKKSVSVDIKRVYKNQKEPRRSVRLFCAVLKKDNFEWVVEKATEIGVKEITPVTTDRTVKLNLRVDRLEKIALEAAEQAGRGVVPNILEPKAFEKAAEELEPASRKMFFRTEEGTDSLKECLSKNAEERLEIFVGPEGGWSENEVALALSYNMEFRGLGGLTLRAETAAIVGSYLMVNLKV